MSQLSVASIPQLKTGITITPYTEPGDTGSPRFLLAHGDSHFLIAAKARALIVALLRQPDNGAELEVAFQIESGVRLPAAQLLALVVQTVPAVLFADAPVAVRKLPFIVSLNLLPARAATHVTAYLAWLFFPRLAIWLVLVFMALHLAVLPVAMHMAPTTWSGWQMIVLISLFLLSGLLHELGHTAACRHFRCQHGAIGIGLYFIFPAWYADVTHAWRLGRRQRAVVDLGGVYFQSIFLIAIDVCALTTGNPVALKLAWLITFTMLLTLNPVFKFDGYWLLSDLSGLHNLHQQVRQSSAALMAALMGRRAVTPPTVRSSILLAYTALSLGYFAYFASFLVHELALLATTLLPRVNDAWSALVTHVSGPAWPAVVAVGTLGGLLAWPVMVVLATLFFIDKLRRSVLEIVASVQAARAPAGTASVGKI